MGLTLVYGTASALAGIMWMSLLREKEVRISFGEFVKYGLAVTPISLLACLAVLALVLGGA